MTDIKFASREDGYNCLFSYNRFHKFGTEVIFEVDDNGKSEIVFKVSNDTSKSNYSIEMKRINDRKFAINYFNPTSVTSGTTSPILVFSTDSTNVYIHFFVNILNNQDFFQANIEFLSKPK